ncbi:hypothetical protein TREMEDRAFT_18648, partial [Tremella mesenterica DSM 1558]|uniref:uncharacterized protein n=1 Tax=Tremella mesenterica (strain ATCC 24925 / CBS 8224 / DSM 1558 / NBRC 9311 / NRRL Y-6157 / RJB 2259-6 / UBC 559-6) TaxID=578456 RepID=UPI00032D6250
DDILDDLVNLESRFYTQGYEEGHAHGALHGIYEGRALGQEKAFELWEEVGYYEGFAEVWVELLSESNMAKQTSNSHSTNPDSEKPTRPHYDYLSRTDDPDSHTHPATHYSDGHGDQPPKMKNGKEEGINSQSPELDLLALLNSIRAKYKLLCASLNLHPRLVQSSTNTGKSDTPQLGYTSGIDTPFTSGMGGLLSGVDTKKLGF